MYNVTGAVPCVAAVWLNSTPVITCHHPFILHLILLCVRLNIKKRKKNIIYTWSVCSAAVLFKLPRYHLKDVIVGKIYFLLVRIKLKQMELAIVRNETTDSGSGEWKPFPEIPSSGFPIPVQLSRGFLITRSLCWCVDLCCMFQFSFCMTEISNVNSFCSALLRCPLKVPWVAAL